ncbi:hypothetical protein SAZ_20330 [Streptomyces noursei ZPM]|nr:hypothetical protein [Streptomyces noursei]AKA04547.1 hypothetical protein SAZ_20330 [Streptomyces noursei ZPM]EXU88795.1 hypothetical protein P354_27210 [Streptomyces noursei PD-1]MCZ0971241.1 hypothetical protein [Streptomyces noursei]UWS72926.1 hypothetical protein N1H47_17705 [Streptomyces noursei]
MRTTRIAVAVAAGVVMMAGLTACNGGGDKSNGTGGGSASGGSNDAAGAKSPLDAALASLKAASQQTNGKNSAKVEGTTKNGAMTQTMKGAMDWASGMHMSVDITQAGGPMGGSGKPMKALYTPDAMYMNMGMPMGGKNWIKYDYDVMAKKMGAAGALMKDMMNNNNPGRSVDLLIASGKVKEVGKEDVRGVQATHYSGTLSVSELTRMQTKNVSEADLKSLEGQLQALGAKNETIDLWVSSDNLLVKKHEQMDAKSPYDSTVYYSDYGTKVSVTPPPASDTTEYK